MINYRFTIGIITLISGILSAACIIVGVLAVENNFDAFSNPVMALQYARNHELSYWFMILDMFGYYLLLAPIIFYLHQQYKYRSPWTNLFTFSGLAYVLIGAIGAAILAALWPELMQQYLAATPQNKETITSIFSTTTLLVTKGLWNILEVIFAAVWLIGIGTMLYKENKFTGLLSIITGISTLLDAAGNIFNLAVIAETGLTIYLVAGIAWPLVMGIRLIRQSKNNNPADKSDYNNEHSFQKKEIEETGEHITRYKNIVFCSIRKAWKLA